MIPPHFPGPSTASHGQPSGIRRSGTKTASLATTSSTFAHSSRSSHGLPSCTLPGCVSTFPPDIPIKALEAGNPVKPGAIKKLDKIWSDIEKETDEDLQNVILGVEKDGILSGADQLKGQLKYDPKTTFNLANPRAVKYFKETGGSLKYIKDIQGTTKGSLQRLMVTALDEGWSYNQAGQEIRKLFDGPISRERARLIAVTESARSDETGNHIFAQSIQDDGVKMEKYWQNSQDGKVSDGCLENSAAGWIPLNEEFPSGDQEPPRFPGCRCFAMYRESQGAD